MIFADSAEILMIGRFFSGLTAGGVFVLVPLYISEIADDSSRGILGSFFILAVNFGTLLMFVAGNYLSYSLTPQLMIALPIIFALTFAFLPETPQHLLKRGKSKQAENALMFLRGCERGREAPQKIKNELLQMSSRVEIETGAQDVSILTELSKIFYLENHKSDYKFHST